jgi:hypothetical protein
VLGAIVLVRVGAAAHADGDVARGDTEQSRLRRV